MSHRTLLSWLSASMRENSGLVALRVRREGRWHTWSYRELDELSSRLAVALLDLGLSQGDRVAIHAGNSPEWTVVDIACLKASLVSVPVYTTNTPYQVAHVLRDSGARAVVCGTAGLLEVASEAIEVLDEEARQEGDDGARVQRLIMRGPVAGVPAITDLIAAAPPLAEIADDLAERAARLSPDDMVTIIYTSGTTGDPKGVVITHRMLCHQLAAIATRFEMPRGERNMSFLPLSHAYERAWTYVVLAAGMESCSVTDPKAVAAAMIDIQPSTFVSVPRLYEKVYAGAHAKAGHGLKRGIFDWAVRVGGIVELRRAAGRSISPLLAAQLAIADRLVLRNVRAAVGGHKYVMAAGGAPLRREVEEFFLAAGLPVYQGYGLTETAPMVSCNAPGMTRFGTVGRPVPGTLVRIAAETGEVLVRGDNVTPGYYERPEETALAIDDDGWFHTGDVGYLDRDGYLVITDRIKDLVVTTQGKNVAPGPIESALAADPLVEAALVVGDGRPYLTALVQPSFDDLEAHARAQGWRFETHEELLALGEVEAYYDDLVGRIGRNSAKYERIQKFRLLADPLTMDAGELTPTLKVRRRPVEQRYAALIREMYA